LRILSLGERHGNRTKLNEEEFSSKLIHIVTIIIVYLDPHEDIIVLPLNQVKKLIHTDQTQHPQELWLLVSLRID